MRLYTSAALKLFQSVITKGTKGQTQKAQKRSKPPIWGFVLVCGRTLCLFVDSVNKSCSLSLIRK